WRPRRSLRATGSKAPRRTARRKSRPRSRKRSPIRNHVWSRYPSSPEWPCSKSEEPTMPLLEPDVLKITPEASEPAIDRAPDWVAGGTPEPLRSQLSALLGEEKILARA